MMHILHSSFYRCRVLKNNYILCRKFKTPSCSDQCDLNIPDVVITTCQVRMSQEDLNAALDQVREVCLLRLKYGYFSLKNAWIRYRRTLFTLINFILRVLDELPL